MPTGRRPVTGRNAHRLRLPRDTPIKGHACDRVARQGICEQFRFNPSYLLVPYQIVEFCKMEIRLIFFKEIVGLISLKTELKYQYPMHLRARKIFPP